MAVFGQAFIELLAQLVHRIILLLNCILVDVHLSQDLRVIG
jgi:hypothetical protein